MKLPAVFRKTKPLDTIRDEGIVLQARAEAIAAEIARLDASRPDIVLDGLADDVVSHDAARSRLVVELEQVSARLGRLDGERAAAEHEADQVRRRAVYAAAKRRRSEGVATLAAYEKAARAAAEALLTLATIENEIATANDSDNLPEGFDFLPPAEPDNSTLPKPDVYHPPQRLQATVTSERRGTVALHDSYTTPGHTTFGSPGRPHQSILQRTYIAGLKPGEVLFGSTIFGGRFR